MDVLPPQAPTDTAAPPAPWGVEDQKQLVLDRIEGLQQQLGLAHEQMAGVEAERSNALAHAAEAQKKYNTLAEKMSTLGPDGEALKKENDKLRLAVQALQNQAARTQNDLQRARDEVATVSAELHEARSALEEIKSALE